MGCISGYNQTTKTCKESKDEGYNSCSQSEDEGYNSCDDWGWFSWLCDAWTWVSNIVCVLWTWVKNVVCVAWNIVTVFVCVVVDTVATIIRVVANVIAGLLSPILNAIALILQFLFEIPVLGRILQAIWGVVTAVVSAIMGLVDALLWILGIRPEKRLRLVVMNQRDEKGQLVASDADIMASVNLAIQVYRDDANIRVIPYKVFDFSTPAADSPQASDQYVTNLKSNSTPETLDVNCGAADFTANLGFAGSQFQNMMTLGSFWTNWSRLIGIGAPIFAFSVRSFPGSHTDGCSMGPLTDYILVEFAGASTDVEAAPGAMPDDSSILPHEMGHCCNLWHVDPSNLMQPDNPRTTNLSAFQIIMVRASRHVTYL